MSRQKKITDQEVLEATLKVICEKGHSNFSLVDVSNEVGLSPATIIQRFKSKNELVLEAFKSFNKDFENHVTGNDYSDRSSADALIDFIVEMSERFEVGQIGNQIELLMLDVVDPQMNKIARDHFFLFRKKVKQIISEGLKTGEFRKENSAEDLVLLLEAFWIGVVIQWAIFKNGTLKSWVRSKTRIIVKQWIK